MQQEKDKNVEVAASDAAYNLIPQLEYLLAIMADGYDWPNDVIAQLTVSYDDGKLSMTHPESMDKQINDLQYGDGSGTPPRPLINNFIRRAESAIQKSLANNTLDLLLEMEEVF
jgi:hypothetical protein